MMSATRNGRAFVYPEEGFWEAWSANQADITKSIVAEAVRRHAERMIVDPVYRAEEEARAAEYDAIFNGNRS